MPAPLFEPLGKHHDREAFDCGTDVLNRYIREQAGQNLTKKIAATFVLVGNTPATISGYYSLSIHQYQRGRITGGSGEKIAALSIVRRLLLENWQLTGTTREGKRRAFVGGRVETLISLNKANRLCRRGGGCN